MLCFCSDCRSSSWHGRIRRLGMPTLPRWYLRETILFTLNMLMPHHVNGFAGKKSVALVWHPSTDFIGEKRRLMCGMTLWSSSDAFCLQLASLLGRGRRVFVAVWLQLIHTGSVSLRMKMLAFGSKACDNGRKMPGYFYFLEEYGWVQRV